MFALTKQEKYTLFFLGGVILLGSLLNFALKANASIFHFIDAIEKNRTFIKIDLNKATKEQLIDLPDIGEVMAQRIIDYREEEGLIRSIHDLRKIKGMNERRINTIKPLLKNLIE